MGRSPAAPARFAGLPEEHVRFWRATLVLPKVVADVRESCLAQRVVLRWMERSARDK